MESFISSVTVRDIALNSAIVAAVIRVVWAIVSWMIQHFREFLARVSQEHSITLGPYKPALGDEVDFGCLLVRYGTDAYLENLASDTDRFEGRLRNKIIPIDVVKDEEGQASLQLQLPVHKRLGTQFKCVADVKKVDRLSWVRDFLNKCEKVAEVSESSSPFRNRLFILLEDFGTIETVDGHTNNMCYPH